MISIARTLGAPETVPAGRWPQNVEGVEAGLQLAFDIGDDVHHVRIALDHHVLGQAYRPDPGHAAAVVSPEIEQLDVFGALLSSASNSAARATSSSCEGPPFAGAGDGPTVTVSPSSRTRISGDAPTTWKSARSK